MKFTFKLFSLLFLLGICTPDSFSKLNMNMNMNTNSEAVIRNFALNLADTKLLKISTNAQSITDEDEQFQTVGDLLGQNEHKNTYEGSVFMNSNGELTYRHKYHEPKIINGKKLIARGRYVKSLEDIGWSKLYIETFDNSPPEVQAWAAGYIEGKLCAQEIIEFYKNLVGIHESEKIYLQDVFNFYSQVEEGIRFRTSKSYLAKVPFSELEYWISVTMIQAQTDGLLAGYSSVKKDEPLTLAQVYFINADGEVPELLSVFKYRREGHCQYGECTPKSEYSFKSLTHNLKHEKSDKKIKFSQEYLQYFFGTSDPEKVWQKLMVNSHCSAIIKAIKSEDNSLKDILIGHTTWDSYSEMHRIFKIYKFSYTMYENHKKNSHVMFSSYPGTLTSTDDFYLVNKKLVITETTIEILDRALFEKHMPFPKDYVPNYIRISVSNRLSSSGLEWTNIFQKNNGGTYNSQWMILDLSKLTAQSQKKLPQVESQDIDRVFDSHNKSNSNSLIQSLFQNFVFKQKSNNSIPSGLFYILEQIPGYIEVKEMTDHLFSNGYWASFNRPYLEKIYIDAGYYSMFKQYGRTYSYNNNSRATLISQRIQSVNSVDEMRTLMRMNQNLSLTDYVNTISPRYDLASNSAMRKPSGGIDSKVLNMDLFIQGAVYAISGPSVQSGAAPFRWSNWKTEPHYGLPAYWNFGWIKFDEEFILK